MPEIMQTINWKTTGFGLGYILCKVAGAFYPEITGACEVIEPLLISAGFISSVDAGRVQSIVRAVDVLAHKNGIDPATLVPLPVEVK